MTPSKRADELIALGREERRAQLATLSESERKGLRPYWGVWAHEGQLAPEGAWHAWLIMAGRGYGKTRAGAEWVRAIAEADPTARIALVGDSLGEARRVMIEGPSGLLAIAQPARRPAFEPSKRQLTWGNGAVATLYSAGEPESLRGPQHSHASRARPRPLRRHRSRARPGLSPPPQPTSGPARTASLPRTRPATGCSRRPMTGCGCSIDRPARCCSIAAAGSGPRRRPRRAAEPSSTPRRGRPSPAWSRRWSKRGSSRRAEPFRYHPSNSGHAA